MEELLSETYLSLGVFDHDAIFKQVLKYRSHHPIPLMGRFTLITTHVKAFLITHGMILCTLLR